MGVGYHVMFVVFILIMSLVHVLFNWAMPVFSIVCTYVCLSALWFVGWINGASE